LAAAGLDIVEGRLFTLPRGRYFGAEGGPWAVQYLSCLPAEPLDGAGREAVAARLAAWVGRWLSGETAAVRAEVAAHWVEALRRRRPRGEVVLPPLELELDNRADPEATVLHVWGADAPGFLHGFALGLAMRRIRVRAVEVRTDGRRVVDRFWVTDAAGRKVITEAAKGELSVLAVLFHGFAHSLVRAADPALALAQFDALLERLARRGRVAELEGIEAEALLPALAAILGSGVHLFEDFLRLAPEQLLPVVAAVARGEPVAPPPVPAGGELAARRAALVAWRDAELFRIDCDHLLHPERPFGAFGEALAELADRVVAAAWSLALEEVGLGHRAEAAAGCGWALFGLGKLGGRELGFASDLELLFLQAGGDPEEAARLERAVQAFRRNLPARRAGIFELDLRLRPYGDDGPLCPTLDAFRRYYRPGGPAHPFERQALVRLRPLAGDPGLVAAAVAARDRFTYGPEPFDAAAMVELRRRQIASFVPAGRVHLKYGPGGVVEVEYTVQALQIRHGHRHPEVRLPGTLAALAALEGIGAVAPAEAAGLRAAYLLLRTVIDALRLERGNARDLLLPDPGESAFAVLARRLHRDPGELARELAERMAWVARRFRERFGGGAGDPG
ncbi:MAG: hypothetical protein D6739_06555, partial [Nitrospirae bacterium]